MIRVKIYSCRKREKINNKWETIKIFKFKDINPVNGKVRKHYKPLTPMMNEQGINWFKGRLSPLVSKNIIMSNYDEPRILQTLKNDLILIIAISIIPAGLIGLFFEDIIDDFLRKPIIVAGALIFGSILFILTEKFF